MKTAIDRRAALAALGSGFALAAGAGAARAGALGGYAAGDARLVALAESTISGGEIAPSPPPSGTRLALAPAPERRFSRDSLAARDGEGRTLGYLAGRDARLIAPLLAAGLPIEARVVGRAGRRSLRVRLEARLAG